MLYNFVIVINETFILLSKTCSIQFLQEYLMLLEVNST